MSEETPPQTPPPLPPPPDTPEESSGTRIFRATGAEADESTVSQAAVEAEKLNLGRSKLAAQISAVAAAIQEEAAEEAEPVPAAPVDLEALGRTVEALLFAGDAPLSPREMARAAGARTADVRKALEALRALYEAQRRPCELAEVAQGYRLVTRAEFHPAIQKLKSQRAQRKLTPAALETLALIAYSKEPVGRAEIEAVRGVDAGPVLRQLLERKLIRIAGRGQGLGQALLYAISTEFLEHFGLKSAQALPRPGEFKSA